ncbi:MAG TPA: TolC family protein [Candidatus Xenobia bacterium]|jgi:outer membrane protein TolC
MRKTALLLLLLTTTAAFCEAPVVHERLTMDQAVDLALKQRPELQPVADKVRREEMATGSGLAALAAPASPGLGTSERPAFLAKPVFNDVMTLSKPLSNGPRVQRQVASDLMGTEATEDAQRAQVTEIIRTTRQQWLTAMLAREKSDVYHDIVSKEAEANQLAQSLLEAGSVPQVVIYRAKLAVADTQQQLNNADCEASKAVMDLKLAMGVDQASDVTLNGKLADKPTPLPDLSAVVQLALQQRPDLEAARLELTRAEMQAQERNASQATRTQAVLLKSRTDAISQIVKRDVYKAYADVQNQTNNLTLTAPAIDAAQENYRIAVLRFQTGRGIQLEVIDALGALGKAQVNNLEAACDYQKSLVELNWAIGGGAVSQ